jgi:N-acetylglucosaminyldiphosphoundecaprenol N-acetyl-beta-D-mannosaminyltransferase
VFDESLSYAARGKNLGPIVFFGQRFCIDTADGILLRLGRAVAAPPESGMVILHANLHSMFNRSRNGTLRAIMGESTTVVLFEGIALKLARLSTSLEWIPDVSGTDLVPLFLRRTDRSPLRVALVGGKPAIAQRAAAAMGRSAPSVKIVAVAEGYGDLSPTGTIQKLVAESKPDVVLLGLGTPLQEITAESWREAGTAPLIWCVGGLFDYWAGARRRSPIWIQRCRMEWLWRLARHPTFFWRRTLVEGPWLLMQLMGEAKSWKIHIGRPYWLRSMSKSRTTGTYAPRKKHFGG